MRILRLFVAGFLVAGLALPFPVSAQRGPVAPEMRAMVKSVDATASTITVATGGDRGGNPPTEKTLTLAKDIEVALGPGGRGVALTPGKVADLAAGFIVVLSLTADQKTVTSILAEGPTVRGVLKSADPRAGTLTVTTSPGRGAEGGEQKTVTVGKKTEIAIDDGHGRRFSIKEGKLGDLAGGSLVTVWMSLDQKEALAILAEGPMFGGVVKGTEKKTITVVAGGRGQPGDERTFETTAESTILIDDGKGRRLSIKEGTLADIPPGAAAMVRLTLDGGAIALIRVEGPVVPGIIKSVNPANGTITFAIPVGRNEVGEEKTLPLTKDARVIIDNAEHRLGDIKIPENGILAAIRLSLDQKSIQGVISAGGR
jgi:hypothetical protein